MNSKSTTQQLKEHIQGDLKPPSETLILTKMVKGAGQEDTQANRPGSGIHSSHSRHIAHQAQQVSTTNTTPSQPSQPPQSEEDARKLEKLRKLEAWKQKQEERKKLKEQQAQQAKNQENATASSIGRSPESALQQTLRKKTTTLLKPSKLAANSTKKFGSKKTLLVRKTNIFGGAQDDEEAPIKKHRFIPTVEPTEEEEASEEYEQTNTSFVSDDVDPLDAFMQELNNDDTEMVNADVSTAVLVEEADDESKSRQSESVDDNSEAKQLLQKLRSKKSKDIHAPKYNLKEMEPFPKNFLVEMESIDPDEVINFRVMNNIFINNKKINPVFNFYHLGLDVDTLGVLTNDFRFTAPTPIQSQTIPSIMSGKDVIGIGKTGSGKTMCYLLGMLKHIKQQRPLANDETGPFGIILSPTRELAIQIHETCQAFLKKNELRSICCTGGSELKTQISEIKKGVHIIVATPGRFIDLLTLNNGKLLKTDRITFVTLDEADRLFDLGFEPQINQIMKTIRPDKQCVLFSATFPSKLQAFAVKILKKPIIIAVGNKQVVNENITQLGKVFETEDDKFNYLLQLLGKQSDEKTIIFCESQLQVNFMNRRLVGMSYEPVCIHAGLPAHERTANLQLFKKSTTANILVCTEVLSRGLDVPEVSLVVLYNAARTFAQYVHTTGRTARGNTKGTAISLLSQNEDLQAYILYKCMPEGEVPEDIRDLALSFEKDMKAGKKKITSGFGGKGLDNLDKLRDDTEKKERSKYGEDGNDGDNKNDVDASDDEDEEDIKGPNLDITYNVPHDALGAGAFNAKININDLPQDVRWIATNNVTMSKVTEETSVSVTFRGKFYPEGKEPKEGEEEKLYLLVEGAKEHQVQEAIGLLKSFVIQGLKKATQDRSGKFSM